MSNIVLFEGKLSFAGRGVKIISKSDRARLISALNRAAINMRGCDLREIMEAMIAQKYRNSPTLGSKYLSNVDRYLSGEVGIGLKMLMDLVKNIGIVANMTLNLNSNYYILHIMTEDVENCRSKNDE